MEERDILKSGFFLYRWQAINRMLRRHDLHADLRLRLIDSINNALSIEEIKSIEKGFEVQSYDRETPTGMANAEANARLIASAPELLEQLLYVTRVLEAALPDSTDTLRAECLMLIAKARGES